MAIRRSSTRKGKLGRRRSRTRPDDQELDVLRNEAREGPYIAELVRSHWHKLRALGKDKAFILETELMKARLEQAYGIHPDKVKEFLRRFRHPLSRRNTEVDKFLNDVKGDDLRSILKDYVGYSERFGVFIRLNKNRPLFRVSVVETYGPLLHAKVVEDHLTPIKSDPGESFYALLENNNLEIPDELKEQVANGIASFIQIDDESRTSVISELETVAYRPNAITFVLHNARQPYLLCLVGENVSQETVRLAGKVINAFRKKHLGRSSAGRPTDVVELYKTLKALKKNLDLKETTHMIRANKGNFWTTQDYIERLKRDRKKL